MISQVYRYYDIEELIVQFLNAHLTVSGVCLCAVKFRQVTRHLSSPLMIGILREEKFMMIWTGFGMNASS